MLKCFMQNLLMAKMSAARPECREANLLRLASMPFDLLLLPKQELGVEDTGGRPPPSPHTCMSNLWLQSPKFTQFSFPWSDYLLRIIVILFYQLVIIIVTLTHHPE
jgi:hypothetical protein